MCKNQLQELAQRSCFSLPSYTCIRKGPDHAPRFKASVNFNGEIFESPTYCSTLRQAEHAAAVVALNALSSRGPSKSLTARVLAICKDETCIYKNLLQEKAHRAGLELPVYTNVRSGPGHTPTFSCTVELAGTSLSGEPAKTKKQAEKNAAIVAWSALRKVRALDSLVAEEGEEKEHEAVARVLSSFRPRDVKRRGPHQSRGRRTVTGTGSHRDTNTVLLSEKLRSINLLSNEASSSQKHHQTSLISLIPPPKSSNILSNASSRDFSSIKPLAITVQQQSKGKSQDKSQEYAEKHHYAKPEMNIKSFPWPRAHHETAPNDSSTQRNGYSKLLPLSDKATTAGVFYRSSGMHTGGLSLNPHRMAPTVQIRSVIPVCAAPSPPQPTKPIPNLTASPSSSPANASASLSLLCCCKWHELRMRKLGFTKIMIRRKR
ncbi:PREDICTED: double-stranded RNA-binding protein 3 [Tarenaya hassleriana]|uniref:double-stranded RNA-binding protein 3 n=1 Tax=Tarenaya hassleriana TaxID=28532 RepID=UPI00053C4F3E|nr:PREDICTED: double-stranded RNA-binding protein 3 [Tarenaya hassleriana]